MTDDASTETSPHPARPRGRDRDRRHRRDERRPRHHLEDDPRRRHDAALRHRVRVRIRRARRERLLQVRELARRRQRPHDHVHDGRRRLRPGEDGAGDAPARRAGQGLRDLQLARDRAQHRHPRLPERAAGAAALRRLRRDDVRARLQAVPVDDRLPAELPRRGLDLRQVPRAHEAGRQGRRPLPERRLRQGSDGRPEAGDRALEGEGRRGAAVRGHRRRTCSRRSRG